MAWYVHLSVCFAAVHNSAEIGFARKALKALEKTSSPRECAWMLKDFVNGNGVARGPKGDLFNWGMVGNYTSASDFIEGLRPFWLSLFRSRGAELQDFEHILVFEEEEQSGAVTVYEVSYNGRVNCEENIKGDLVVKTFPDMPFSWHQY